MKTILSILAAAACLISPARAAVLMLDFGPTAIGSATTVSPYHSVNPSAGTSWNSSLGTGDSGALVYSDGTAATGVAYNIGIASGTNSLLATNPGSSSALGLTLSSGIYGGTTSSARDAVFNTTTALSLQISGLAAGTYDIYYVGRNTNRGLADNYTQNLFAAASATSGNFNWSTYSSNTITYGSAASNTNDTTWVQGQNFAKLSVTLAPGDVLNLAFTGTGVETRGFLNSLQVVSVPEPSATLLIAAAGTIFVVSRRRRLA